MNLSIHDKVRIAEERLEKRITPVVVRAFAIPQEFGPVLDIAGKCMRRTDTNTSVGGHFIKKVEENPSFARELTEAAWKRYAVSLECTQRLKTAAFDAEPKMEKVSELFLRHLLMGYSAAIDFVFCHTAYNEAILARLRADGYTDSDECGTACAHLDIIRSEQPPSANNLYRNHTRMMLLHLAHEFGMNNADLGAHTYIDFDWQWYRRNNVPLSEQMRIMLSSEEELRTGMETYIRSEGMNHPDTEVNYLLVREKLLALNGEIRTGRILREAAVKRLKAHARQGTEPVVDALVHFAGQAYEANETLHAGLCRAENLVCIAGERRGLDKDGLFNALLGFAATGAGTAFFESMERETLSWLQ